MNRRKFLRSSVAAGVATSLPASSAMAQMFSSLTQVTADVRATTGAGAEISLSKASVKELGESLSGPLLLPGNDGYEAARRVLNLSIDKHPAMVVQPTGAADIKNAVAFAKDHDMLLAVKCGGHSYSGRSTCDDGMQIDLSRFRNVRVDAAARTAYVSGGSLLGEIDHETMALGLVTTAGTVSHTGVGGLTLGAGFGRLARRFGLALDNVKGADVVLADGSLVHASADENADLFWGIRGGGGNFGIVTSFEFGLHPMQRQVIGGDIVFPLDRAKDVMKLYAEFSTNAPDDLYTDLIVMSMAGQESAIVMIHVCYSGPAENAARVLEPLQKLGKPIANGIGPIDYVALQKSWDSTDPRNVGTYIKSGFINEFPQDLAARVADGIETHPDRDTMVFFQQSGGAIGRVSPDATAFAHRKSQSNMYVTVSWPLNADPEPHIKYVRNYWRQLEPNTDGYYANDVDDEMAQDNVNRNYRDNFDRLVTLKKRYDPTNLFRLNANIRPST